MSFMHYLSHPRCFVGTHGPANIITNIKVRRSVAWRFGKSASSWDCVIWIADYTKYHDPIDVLVVLVTPYVALHGNIRLSYERRDCGFSPSWNIYVLLIMLCYIIHKRRSLWSLVKWTISRTANYQNMFMFLLFPYSWKEILPRDCFTHGHTICQLSEIGLADICYFCGRWSLLFLHGHVRFVTSSFFSH